MDLPEEPSELLPYAVARVRRLAAIARLYLNACAEPPPALLDPFELVISHYRQHRATAHVVSALAIRDRYFAPDYAGQGDETMIDPFVREALTLLRQHPGLSGDDRSYVELRRLFARALDTQAPGTRRVGDGDPSPTNTG